MIGVVELAEGITEYRGSDEGVISKLAESHYRFLDYLWLPVPLSELTQPQVLVTNRFRETRIGSDSQFNKANRARKAARLAMDAGRARCVIEVGMGSFPIFIDGDDFQYQGFDIDPVAVAKCKGRGLSADLSTVETIRALDENFDFLVAIYVFHFAYNEDEIHAMKSRLTTDAVGIFTVIVADNQHFLRLLAHLGPELPWLRVLKLPRMASKEFWVVTGGIGAAHRAEAVVAAIAGAYDS